MLTVADWGYKRNWLRQQELALMAAADVGKSRLEDMAVTRFNAVESLGALFMLHPDTTPAAFAHFASLQMSFNPPIRSLQYADSATRVTYVYPARGNEIVISDPMQLIDDPLRGPYTRRAIVAQRAVLQGPFALRQGGLGMVLRSPIIGDAGRFIGLAIGVFDVPVLTDEAFRGVVGTRLQVSLADAEGRVFMGPPIDGSMVVERTVAIADTHWTMRVGRTGPLDPPAVPRLVIWLGGGALLLAIGMIVHLTQVQNERLARLVAQRTESLRKSEAFLRSTQALARVGGWQWDVAARTMVWTEETYRIHGMVPGEAGTGAGPDATRSLACYDEADRPVIEGLFARCIEFAEAWDREFAFTALDGRRKWVRILGRPVVVEDRVVRLVGNIMDITEQKALQDQLRHAQKMDAMRTLTGGVAHAFNNILSIIIGNAELAQDEPVCLSADQRASLDEIVTAALRGREVVQQLLDAHWRGRLATKPMDLGAVAGKAVDFIKAMLPPTVEFQVAPAERPLPTLGDPTAVQQVLIHLCNNAVQAMEGEGGQLTVSLAPVVFEAEVIFSGRPLAPGRYVCVTVADTGHGIAPEHMERVFDPFFTTRDVGQGAGMGLALVAGIVHHHHGGVQVTSQPGRGTTVRCCFPEADSAMPEALDAPADGG